MTGNNRLQINDRLNVSVIIPCYRCTQTIYRAVESVVTQTKQPKEIILIDDFSNDDEETLTALKTIRDMNSGAGIDIIVLSLSKNSGPGSARNEGWAKSNQPYLAFLDSDDSWHPKKLEVQYEWMLNHPDVVLTAHSSILTSEDQRFPDLPKKIVFISVNKYKLLFKNYFPTRSVMLKQDLYYKFIPEKRYAEDYLLWLSIVFSGGRASFLNADLAFSYKMDFGDGGLTSNLWAVQLGIFDTYRRLFNLRLISFCSFSFISIFSFFKFLRRWCIVKLRSFRMSLSKHNDKK